MPAFYTVQTVSVLSWERRSISCQLLCNKTKVSFLWFVHCTKLDYCPAPFSDNSVEPPTIQSGLPFPGADSSTNSWVYLCCIESQNSILAVFNSIFVCFLGYLVGGLPMHLTMGSKAGLLCWLSAYTFILCAQIEKNVGKIFVLWPCNTIWALNVVKCFLSTVYIFSFCGNHRALYKEVGFRVEHWLC